MHDGWIEAKRTPTRVQIRPCDKLIEMAGERLPKRMDYAWAKWQGIRAAIDKPKSQLERAQIDALLKAVEVALEVGAIVLPSVV